MTRELKLALIFGFSLLLVVTVLISDHLSKARDAKLAADLPEAPALVPAAPREVLVASEPRLPNTPIMTGDPAPQDSGFKSASKATQEAQPADHTPEEFVQGGKPTRVAERAPRNDDTFIIPRGGTPLVGTVSTGLDEAARNIVNPAQPDRVGAAPEKNADIEQSPAAATARMHTVANGETLIKIAKKYYGNSANWKRIAEANPKLIGKNGEVRVGAKLTIPPEQPANAPASQPGQTPRKEISERVIAQDQPEKRLPRAELPESGTNKAGKSEVAKADQKAPAKPQADAPGKTKTEVAKADPKTRPAVQEPSGSPESEKGKASYIVRSGDTLSEIAQRELGSASRVKEIIRLNKDAFPDGGTAVRIGMVLKMPRA